MYHFGGLRGGISHDGDLTAPNLVNKGLFNCFRGTKQHILILYMARCKARKKNKGERNTDKTTARETESSTYIQIPLFFTSAHVHYKYLSCWWYPYPSEKIWVRQLGSWHSQLNENIKSMFQSPPTSCSLNITFPKNKNFTSSDPHHGKPWWGS